MLCRAETAITWAQINKMDMADVLRWVLGWQETRKWKSILEVRQNESVKHKIHESTLQCLGM